MATQSDARSEQTRFETDVDATSLIEGDRIARKLVARHADQLGEPIHRTPPEANEENPDSQLVQVTATDSMDDTHSAILFDPESDVFIRATRHDSQSAWSQAEADWTVNEVGTNVVVTEVHELERPDEEQDQPADEYAQEWVEILFDDIRHHDGGADYHDERQLRGSSLMLQDSDGRKCIVSISLEDQ